MLPIVPRLFDTGFIKNGHEAPGTIFIYGELTSEPARRAAFSPTKGASKGSPGARSRGSRGRANPEAPAVAGSLFATWNPAGPSCDSHDRHHADK
jgi:hypothetical protein